LGIKRWSEWAIEQKLTSMIALLAIISNNPLYILHAYRPSWFWIFLDFTATSLFHSMVYVTIFIVLNSVVYKNIASQTGWITKETRFGVLVVICKFNQSVYHCLRFVLPQGLLKTTTEPFLVRCEIFLGIGFAIWGSGLVSAVVCTEDLSERARTILYSMSAGIVITVVGIVSVIGKSCDLFEGTMIEFVSLFVVHNTFALMMLYFHWPYQTEVDRVYEGTFVADSVVKSVAGGSSMELID
jgi:hypothetical protein